MIAIEKQSSTSSPWSVPTPPASARRDPAPSARLAPPGHPPPRWRA